MKKLVLSIISLVFFTFTLSTVIYAETCGMKITTNSNENAGNRCSCATSSNQVVFMGNNGSSATYCCGTVVNGSCRASQDEKAYGCGAALGDSTVPAGATCNCPGAQWEGYSNWGLFGGALKDKNVCCGWVVQSGGYFNAYHDQCLSANPDTTASSAFCGTSYPSDPKSKDYKTCICGGGGGTVDMGGGQVCCGWLLNGKCSSTDTGVNDVEVSKEMLDDLNPLAVGGGDTKLNTPGAIISKALGSFVFPIAGIILFVQLLLGGFSMLTGATNSKSTDEGKQKITAAIIGFLLLFAAYWIAQLLELIFGIRILS